MQVPERLCYFAYGSNLLFARLHARTPSITNRGIARLDSHRLHFNKPGGDGSGKCGIESGVRGEVVLGVLYEMCESEKPALDEIEGLGHGYSLEWVDVVQASQPVRAFTYYPSKHDCELPPYDWYKNFVLKGALENNFPDEYINKIRNVIATKDEDSQRRETNLGIADGLVQ